MNRYNRKFNAWRKRFERWYVIKSRISEFEGIVNDYDGATPEDVKVLKEIHRKLYECQQIANERLKDSFRQDKRGVLLR